MLKKSKKLLAFMLSIALVFTTFGSDLASAVVYAEEDAQQAQAVETWSDIVEDVSVAQKESIGSDEDASGGSDAASEDAQGEETPAEPDEGDGGAVDVPENPTPEEPAEGGEAENPAEPPAENPSETPSEASTESTIDAAGAASTGSSSSEDATEASSEAASEASSEDASEASSEASSEDASEASSEASSEDAAAEASSVEEKLVTVRYKATKGGRVSLFKETININDENAKFEGATATAWNDKYSFVDWTDEDGNQVCADATFVPSGIESDATFTANFIAEEDIEDKMPAIVRENVPAGGLSVSVNAEVGVFPKGTEAVISPVSDNQALESAKDALGDNVAEAKGAEIKFIYEGEEIQPADNKYVHVSLALNTPIEGESFSVVHDHDGEAEVLPDSQVESVDENGAEFKTDEFSIYIVAGEIPEDNRLNVIFKNGDTVISSVYVKKNDLYEGADHVNHFEDIVYDPGVGELDDGVMFRGWAENNAYTTTTEGLDIDGVRAKVRAKLEAGVNDGATVTYYAMLFKAYTVSYLDDRTASLGSSEIKFRADDTTEYQQYTVNMSFTPSDNEHKFEGWLATKGGANIDGYTEGTRYQNGTSIGIKGDVTFSVDLPAGHWLVFDENGKGATYNAPQFVKADEVTQKPCEDNEMVRNGYEFQGWFTGTKDTNGNVTLGEAFEFGHALTEMTTIFAKWKAKENAAYTVLIWKQNIDANGYDFEKSIPLSGTSGSSINIVSIQGNGNSAYTRIDGTDYKYTGFHYESTDQDGKTITPEGNTVVNVYYNRNQRKLTFQVQYTVSTNDNDNNPTKYGFINSNFQQIYWRNGAFRTSNNNNGTVYNGTVFVKSNTWLTIKEITALYGQSIKDNFPIVGTDGVNYEGSWWEEPSHNTYDAKVAYIDIMLDADVVFHKYDLPQLYNYDRTINYYVEALPGETGQTVSYNGKTFVKYTSQVTNGYMHWTEDEDYFELAGFTKFGYTPSNAWNIRDDVRTVNCYYTRNTYKINFMDGSYFDGNDNRLNEIDRGHLGIKENILYQANISAYADQEPSTIPTGYVFEGWYVDDACTQKYNFNKMPEGGITVYAKWRQIQYRVFLHPNAGEDSTLDWGSETQAMNFRISYGGKVDTPTGRRTGFEFVGWYLDPGFDNSFNADAFVLNETTVTAGYNKDTDLTDPMNKWGKGATYNSDKTGYNGGDRFWITKKLDLYARWRSTLDGATGIGIIYDANGGSPAPSDTNLYADTANAAAGAAPTTTPKITENGKEYETRFSHWVVQKWNSTTEQYEDTTDTVLPGATFVVKKENAKEVDLGVTEDNKPIKSYTVQLRAEYVKVEMPTPTHIIWFNNYDGGSYRIDPKVDVNVAVKVYGIGDGESIPTRAGYTFKGWARDDEHENGLSEVTDLFIEYNQETGTYNHEFVAADEKQPYHALYAVWDAAEVDLIYDANGGTGSMDPSTGKVGTDVEVKENGFTNPGYKFDGWNTSADGNGTPYDEHASYTLQAEGNILYAIWTEDENDTYKISYISAGNGSVNPEEETHQVLDTQDKIAGSKATAAAGYTFDGWYKDGEKVSDAAQISAATVYGNLNTRQKDGLPADTTFEARFVIDVNDTYTISYTSAGNGSVTPEDETHQVLDTQDKIVGSKATADAGYKFDGWYKGGEKVSDTAQISAADVYGNLNTREKDGLPADTTFEARFVIDVDDTYTISYTTDGNGSADPEDETHQVLDTQDKIAGSKATAKAGYVFEGWYKNGEKVADTAQISAETVYGNLNTREKDGLPADTTFEARFIIDVNDTYIISYISAGNGSVTPENETHQVLDTQDKIAGSKATAAAGYKFDGWYKDGEKIANAGVELTAEFIYSRLNTRQKDGLPTDTTFEARFVIDVDDTYTISYTTDGNGSADPEDETHQVLDTQDKISGSKAKANSGYVFEGWYKNGEKVADTAQISAETVYANLNTREKDGLHDDTTFEARFIIDVNDTYTISYTSAGNGSVTPEDETHQVLDTQDKIAGSKATAAAGYKFDGWYKDGEKIANAGVELTAEFIYSRLNTREEDGLPADTTFEARFV
ncbi:InlB B-repeat-containing protein, partial [Butyrivibrio sp. MC2021]|uniref:InlB B-repeat-containing protein n=1 Tax=Butyrivibrio sp. MC2021 TaxID=1408306 RepID=UPI00055A7FED